jgi:hypothetical protein
VVQPVATYEFLSDSWLAAATAARADHADAIPSVALSMNLTVTDAPFSTEHVLVSLDTTRGVLGLASGLLDQADVTIRVDWATAKALLLDGDTTAAMSAFMAGKVTVEGDMAKLLALQSTPLDAASREVVERLREITA